ncbi:hypothetical protein IF129_08610 [Streptomyces chumphonensis]|uniref:Integral membrane protein n=1 Tax=Streptomyces chumphonensis TaxID=1214925 RepID=A0A927EYB0_9ACTN|nr:hypothetical protein [Streptomyces chumphonensis]MBD3931625.1 hypothetical protein [Streptomyces chumphonensis]
MTRPRRSAGRAGGDPADGGRIGSGPGRLLVTLYAVFAVGATSRSAYQIATRFEEAPLPYALSAVAAVVYCAITVALVRGGEAARRTALAGCVAELAGVLVVGTWSVFDPEAFPDTTVWSAYGMGYLFIPLVLPVVGLLWLRRSPAS